MHSKTLCTHEIEKDKWDVRYKRIVTINDIHNEHENGIIVFLKTYKSRYTQNFILWTDAKLLIQDASSRDFFLNSSYDLIIKNMTLND